MSENELPTYVEAFESYRVADIHTYSTEIIPVPRRFACGQ